MHPEAFVARPDGIKVVADLIHHSLALTATELRFDPDVKALVEDVEEPVRSVVALDRRLLLGRPPLGLGEATCLDRLVQGVSERVAAPSLLRPELAEELPPGFASLLIVERVSVPGRCAHGCRSCSIDILDLIRRHSGSAGRPASTHMRWAWVCSRTMKASSSPLRRNASVISSVLGTIGAVE